jgi:hypothetical protein
MYARDASVASSAMIIIAAVNLSPEGEDCKLWRHRQIVAFFFKP